MGGGADAGQRARRCCDRLTADGSAPTLGAFRHRPGRVAQRQRHAREQLDQQLLFEVIENQLADGYPLKVKATLMRLCMTGHSREDALELIACALAPEMFAVVEQQQEFNLPRYEAHLDKTVDPAAASSVVDFHQPGHPAFVVPHRRGPRGL